MQNKNYYLMIAGVICLLTALLHTFGGQIDLVNPLMQSDLSDQKTTELLGAWHMVTVILFVAAYVLLISGLKSNIKQFESTRIISVLFLLFGGVFIIVSIVNNVFAPQWILCLPIGILGYLGSLRIQRSE